FSASQPAGGSDVPEKADVDRAQRLAQDFTRILVEKKDFRSIVKDLYSRDFITLSRCWFASESASHPGFPYPTGFRVAPSVVKEATEQDLQRFYIAASNFEFLSFANLLTAFAQSREDPGATALPAAVSSILSKDPRFAGLTRGGWAPVPDMDALRTATR